MQHHVQNLCRVASFQLWSIGKIRNILGSRSAEKLVHAYITSRLDNGNALPHGLPDSLIAKLQLIQNTAACIVTMTRKYEHITPVLKRLHWLPVKYRIEYKILPLTFRALHGLAPVYLSSLLTDHKPTNQGSCSRYHGAGSRNTAIEPSHMLHHAFGTPYPPTCAL